MKFEEAMKYLKGGWKIRRNHPIWINSYKYIYIGRDIYGTPKIRPYYVYGGPEVYTLSSSDVRADDWEVVK